MITFIDKLSMAWVTQNSLLCVGLDPDITKFPNKWKNNSNTIFEFCKTVIDVTADIVCAFKLQIAYFSALRAENQLEKICIYIKQYYPYIPIILDAKRGDIPITAVQYAREAFERYDVDAITVNPYLGYDSIAPYLEWKNRGVILLCRTSNINSSDFQLLLVNNIPLYQYVAKLVTEKWNTNGQCCLVVGATYPKELACIRTIVGEMPLLVPGVGEQGGDIKRTVISGKTAYGGMIINSSRKILYTKSQDDNFVTNIRHMALETRDLINQFR